MELIDGGEDGGLRAQLLLPLVVLNRGLLELLEAVHLLVKFLDHGLHLRVLIQELWQHDLLVELGNLGVKLRDEAFKLFLKALSLGLLLGLDVG